MASFHSIERSTDPLDHIHTDVCDLKFVQTKGGEKVFYYFKFFKLEVRKLYLLLLLTIVQDTIICIC